VGFAFRFALGLGNDQMKHYLYRLNPPRPTFPADISAAEIELMQKHVSYWGQLMAQGKVAAFGPVADPNGSYGIAIIQLEDDVDPRTFGENDPVIAANAGFNFEVHSMPRIMLPKLCP
jgi:uncharacterized protein